MRLAAGRWKLLHDNVRDSEMSIVIESSDQHLAAPHNFEFALERPETVHLEFLRKGSEKYISVVARKL